jgi:Flp pilus assembly protein TadD
MQGSPRIDELRQKFHENPRRYFAPLANEYRKAGDPEQAIAICRAHLAQQPQHMSGHVVYGQALYDAKRADEARTVFEKALALDPENAIVLRQLGDIAREKGESAEARHWYGKALDLDAQDTEAAAYLVQLRSLRCRCPMLWSIRTVGCHRSSLPHRFPSSPLFAWHGPRLCRS